MQEYTRIDYDCNNDEAEETISLCNLVKHDGAAWDDYSTRYLPPNSNLSLFEQECFEFFSQEWSTKSHRHHQNIIFCGKPIPSRSPTFTKRNERDYSILSKNGNKDENSSKQMNGTKTFGRNDLSVHQRKMLTLTPPTKSSWYMLFLGMAPKIRTSGGAELRDIKSRLSRRQIVGGQRLDDCQKKSRGGFGGLVKALACGEYNHATDVMESIKRISRV